MPKNLFNLDLIPPPFTLLFMPLMIVALIKHRKDVKRRKSKGNRSNDQWNESWF